MNRIVSAFLLSGLLALFSVSCIYDDTEIRNQISGLDGRIGVLEEKMREANEGIATLQGLVSALSSNAFVNSVTETEDGWILSLSNGKILTVRNGKDGKDGENGASPEVGVRMDTDGTFYWTLNGEWMLGPDGKRIPVTGEDGTDGKDAASPTLKLDGDTWYISTDGGLTWQLVGVNPSSDGVIQSIDTSNPEYVLIILSDGTVLRLPTWAAFDALRQYVKQLNINLSSLSSIVSALMDNDYLVSTTPFVEDGVPVGWLLNFSKSGLVVIYSSGDSASPHIGVQQDSDGVYYWTLDGEWLLDENGSKVRAQGSDGADAPAPRLKIDGQYWYISYDDGATWTELGKATGEDGDSFFSEVDVSNDEFVRLVLSDGSVLVVPKYVPLDLVLDLPQGLVLDINENLYIPFSVVGTFHEGVSISALVNGSFDASVQWTGEDSGLINLYEKGSSGGTLVVLLSTSSGTAVVKSAVFRHREITFSKSFDYPTDLSFYSFSVTAPASGGEVELWYNTNTPFSIDTSKAPWIHVLQDFNGSMKGKIVLEIDPNQELARMGELSLSFDEPGWQGRRAGCPQYQCWVQQSGQNLDIGASVIEASRDQCVYEVDVCTPYDGLTADATDGWIKCWMERVSHDRYTLFVDVAQNDFDYTQSSMVYIRRGGAIAASILVYQYNYDNRFNNCKMRFKVHALPENDCTVCLPYMGEMSVIVDWGDSRVSVHEQETGRGHPVRHKYKEEGEYIVEVNGKIEALSTIDSDGNSIARLATIESVLQWGDCHYIESMKNAFRNVTSLRSVAPDEDNCFHAIDSFDSAFYGCINLSEVSSGLFRFAINASDFTNAFYGVGSAVCESPYDMVNGQKVHLYERSGTLGSYQVNPYPTVKTYSGCFHGGHWADQDAIRAAGWE